MRNSFYLRRICAPLLLAFCLAFSLLPGTVQASSKIALNNPCFTVNITCHPPLIYHQGPVQHHPKVYLIFWGPKWTSTDPTVLAIENLFVSLPGGEYNGILMQYYDTSDYVHNDVQVLGTWMDQRALPIGGIGVTSPTNSIYSEMFNALTANPGWQVTNDSQFMVFPQAGTIINKGIQEDCGRHDGIGINNKEYYYSYVDTGGMDSNCKTDTAIITTRVTHEYAETATDPQNSSQALLSGDGWNTIDGGAGEIGDLCEDTGPQGVNQVTYTNDVLGAKPIIQELWDNSTAGCNSGGINATEYLAGGSIGGKHTVQGSINTTYGPYTSILGRPVSEQEQVAGGFASYFEGQVCNGGYKEPDAGQISGSAIYAPTSTTYNMSGGTAYEVQGCNYTLYTNQMGGPAGPLSFPVSNEMALAGGHVAYFGGQLCNTGYLVPGTNKSSGSAIFYNGTSYEVQGCIYTKYMNLMGGPGGQLSFPVSNEQPLAGGRVSYFGGQQCNGGYAVPNTGNLSGAGIFYNGPTYEVQGCIYSAYMNQAGGPAGIGFPVSDEEGYTGGRVSYFAGQGGKQCNGGYKLFSNGNLSGAAIFDYYYNVGYTVQGCIYTAYMNQFGGPGGPLSFPVSNEQALAGGRVSYFGASYCNGGYTVPSSGGNISGAAIFYNGPTYEVQGCIYTAYMNQMGGPASTGFPVSNEEGIGKGRVSYFAGRGGTQCNGGYKVPDTGKLSGNAIFYYYNNTGYGVLGCIYTAYMNQFGGPTGSLGFPVSNEEPIAGGRVSYFAVPLCSRGGFKLPDGTMTGGAIFYNGPTYEVHGCIYDTYMGMGGPNSKLGFPTSNEYTYDSAGDRQSNFQGGYIQWSNTTNLTTTHIN